MNFSTYNYRERKEKVKEILENTDKVNEVTKFPSGGDFTFTNGYKAVASAIFVDLRDSTTLFSNNNDVDIAKVIRGFTSEIIEILRSNTGDHLKEIGIRGDCVFAVYSTPLKANVYDLGERAFYINTYMKMLNKLLEEKGLPTIRAGIGLAASTTLAVKAGRKSSGINNLVWIGESVTTASKLADLGNKNSIKPIVMSKDFYENYIEHNDDISKWMYNQYDFKFGTYYHGNIIISAFDTWINEGMKE